MNSAFAGVFGLVAAFVYLGIFFFVLGMLYRLVRGVERIANALERK
jgi:hypothetical protein